MSPLSSSSSADAQAHVVPGPAASLPEGVSAVVYCEGQFGEQDGTTANGLVRHSERYDILNVVARPHAGADTGQLLAGAAHVRPALASLRDATPTAGAVPDPMGTAPG